MCARHGTKLVGWKSWHQVFAEPKVRKRARASSRDGVWRRSNPKQRDDEQELDVRCSVAGASGHVTIKPSICKRVTFYKSSVYAVKVSCLTLGDLSGVEGTTEPRAIVVDRSTEVSSGHSSWCLTAEGPNNRGDGD